MANFYHDITEEEFEYYKPLLENPIEMIKTELQTLASNYYKSILTNDSELYNSTIEDVKKYLQYGLEEINNYWNGCLVIASNEILSNLFDSNIGLYVPPNNDLKFRTLRERQREYLIKKGKLSDDELKLIYEHNKQSHDITCLGYALDPSYHMELKPNVDVVTTSENIFLINANFFANADEETKMTGEYFFAMGIMFSNRSFENG